VQLKKATMKRDVSEVRKRGYRLLPDSDSNSSFDQNEFRHSEDMLAREANFDAAGGNVNLPYIYVPTSRSQPSEKMAAEQGLLSHEESAKEKSFRLYYEKQVRFKNARKISPKILLCHLINSNKSILFSQYFYVPLFGSSICVTH
jgi:hypothetical protein